MNSTGKFNGTPRNPTSELVGDGFDSRTLSNFAAAEDPDAADHDGNDGVTTDDCSLPTKRQRSASSCCDSIFDYDGPDESEDDYIFDVFATDDDEDGKDGRSTKRRKLSAVSCRNPSPKRTIIELQDGTSDQTQTPLVAAAVQQLDLTGDPLLEHCY